MLRLYEINPAIQAIYDNMVDSETGEINEDAIAMLEELDMQKDEAIEAEAMYYKNLDAEITGLKAIIEKLGKQVKSKELQQTKAKTRIAYQLHPGEKFETPLVKIGWRSSSAVHIADEAGFLEWAKNGHECFLSYKDPTISKKAVGDAIKAGEAVEGAEIVKHQSVQVR